MEEGRPGVRHYVYVDNVGVLGVVRPEVAAALDGACRELDSAGLSTHEREESAREMEMLGVELDGTRQRSRLTSSRYWKLDSGLSALLRRRKVSGRMLEAIVGQCTFAALLVRQSLSVFHSCYKCVRSMHDVGATLWPSVRAEVQAFRDLLPLLESDWSLPWCPYVTATDSSGFGYGECTALWGASTAAVHGRVPERSRFRRRAAAARSHAFSGVQSGPTRPDGGIDLAGAAGGSGVVVEPGSLEETAAGVGAQEWEEVDDFPEIPPALLQADGWKVVRGGRWKLSEDIHLSEARILVDSLERACRTRHGMNQRRLYLGTTWVTCWPWSAAGPGTSPC